VNALESSIAEVWSETLGLQRVGRDDNFFDLGGHSILMIQLRNMLQERLQQNITMLDLFRHPTVSSLAAFLGGAATVQPTAAAPSRGSARRAGGERLKRRLERRHT
jgi:acyl carrier protein